MAVTKKRPSLNPTPAGMMPPTAPPSWFRPNLKPYELGIKYNVPGGYQYPTGNRQIDKQGREGSGAYYQFSQSPFAGTAFEGENGALYSPAGNGVWENKDAPNPNANYEWDYRNPLTDPASGRPVGPDGTVLPEGAQGFTPQGEVDYGPGLWNWLKGAGYRITAPVPGKAEWAGDPLKAFANGDIIEGFKAWGGNFGAVTSNLYNVQNLLGREVDPNEEQNPTLATLVSRTIGESIRGVGDALTALLAQPTERVLGTIGETAENLAEGSVLPSLGKPASLIEKFPGMPDWLRGAVQAADVLTNVTPMYLGWNAIRALAAPPRSWNEVKDVWKTNWEASSIAYSAFADEAIKQEYIRRARSGEDARYLAMELQNPWAEFTGQFVADPLNLLGAGAKTSKLASLENQSRKVFLASDEVGDLLRAATLADKAGDASAAEHLAEVVSAVGRRVESVSGKIAEKAADTAMFGATATGKRSLMLDRIGTVADQLFASARKANNALDVDEGLARMKAIIGLSGDVAEREAAITEILGATKRGWNPNLMLSDAAMELSLTARRMLTDADEVLDADKFLKGLAEAATQGVEGVAEFATKKLDAALKDTFPTVLERVAAREELRALEAAGELPQTKEVMRLQQIVALGDPKGAEFFAKFHAGTRPLYGFVNKILGNVYMGMSPGYAFRNAITNNFHIFIDMGAEAWGQGTFWNPKRWLEIVGEEGWGVYPRRATAGLGAAAAEDGIVDATRKVTDGSFLKNIWEAGVSSVKDGKPQEMFTRVGSAMEQAASMRVAGRSADEMMARLTRKSMPLKELVGEVGLSQQQANAFVNMMIAYKGNGEKAFRALRAAEGGSANINLVGVLAGLNPQQVDLARKSGLFDNIVTALEKGGSVDNVIRSLEDEFGEWVKTAKNVVSDHAGAGADPSPIMQALGSDPKLTDAAQALVNNRYQANSYALNFFKNSVDRVLSDARFFAPSEEVRSAIDALRQKWAVQLGLVENKEHPIKLLLDEVRQFTQGMADKIHGLGQREDWAVKWQEWGMAGDPPESMTRAQFIDAAWKFQRQHADEMYALGRDGINLKLEELLKELQGIAPHVNMAPMDEARAAWETARQWTDAVMVEKGGKSVGVTRQSLFYNAIQKGDTAQAVRILADKYGIATIAPSGAKLDNVVLATLKKYLPGVGENLEDFSVEQVIQAFENQRTAHHLDPLIDDLKAWLGKHYEPYTNAVSKAADNVSGTVAKGERVVLTPEVGAKVHILTNGKDGELVAQLADAKNGASRWRIRYTDGTTDIRQGVVIDVREAAKKTAEAIDEVLIPPLGDNIPSSARVAAENLQGMRTFIDDLTTQIRNNWGQYSASGLAPDVEQKLSAWLQTKYTPRNAEARVISASVANAMRDFTLLNYADKSNFDLALSYVFPYHFWYNRTYANWMERIARNPAIIANYARYRRTLEYIHADAPDFWKQNLNTNELFGLESDHPLFFNLEATLNPINGLTGVDFNDPERRMNWWTRTLDDLGRFGPSVWSPVSWTTAFGLYISGEEEAAARVGGRLVPQTATLKSLLALTNLNVPYHGETDPFVHLFSGGIDPYERNRVGRALSSLVEGVNVNGQWVKITPEQALDAAHQQKGEIWDLAYDYALDQRAPGQLQSYFMGVGFKGRTATDVQIDEMYQRYNRLWNMDSILSADEFKQQMDLLRKDYPWMDTVILSKKSGPERDRALAYNVLSRVPPGQSKEILPLFNLSDEQMAQFYENKGNLSYMTEADRMRFMAGIIELSAALALPADATRAEWTETRQRYNQMQAFAKQTFGEDVWQRVDDYFALSRTNKEAAKLMLANNPVVEAALSWREQAIMDDPLLFDYYGGLDFLNQYWEGEMYDLADAKFGKGIVDLSVQYGTLADQEKELLDTYYQMKDAQDPDAKAFYKAFLDKDSNQKDIFLAAHPELIEYWDFKESYKEDIQLRLEAFSDKIRDVGPELRPDYQPRGVYEVPAAAELGYQFEPAPVWNDFAAILSPAQRGLVVDYFNGGDLSRATENSLTRLADGLGMTLEEFLSTMEQAYYQDQVAPVP